MNEFLQTSIIATILTALLGTVTDDFYLRIIKVRRTESYQEWLMYRKKRKKIEQEWKNGEIIEALIIRTIQGLLIFPMLILLYKVEIEQSQIALDWIIGFIAITVWYKWYSSRDFLSLQLMVIIILLAMLKACLCSDLVVIVTAITMLIIILYSLFNKKRKKYKKIKILENIIKEIMKFELEINMEVITIYLMLYAFIMCNVKIRTCIIFVIIQFLIPIRKAWSEFEQ